MNLIRVGLILIFTVIALGGCAIKPSPLTMDEIKDRANADLSTAFSGQEPVDGPITLYEAMARAILYNLDHKTTLMERALANQHINVARYELLPDLAVSAGYNQRSDYYGAYSRALTGPNAGKPSLIMSTSQEKSMGTADVTMMWNVLDFGVSYAKAQQQADNYMIIEEQRRKAVQAIMQEVRYAYWRAQGAQNLIQVMTGILKRTKSALERADQIVKEKIQPLQVSLQYQQALLENIRLVKNLIREMSTARNELATLMNLPPGAPFTLSAVDWTTLEIPKIALSLKQLEETALIFRPELRQEDYKLRISVLEARKAILSMLPGMNINFGYDYDSNEFLYTNNWASVGAAVSMNIFELFTGKARYETAKTMQELDKIRRQAMTMAVLTQVHLAFRQYKETLDEFRVNKKLSDVCLRLQHLLETNEIAGKGDELEVILSATHALVAQMRHHLIYAQLQNAMGRIYSSAGIDLAPEEVQGNRIPDIALALEQSMTHVETLHQ
jgi:outer membrane protein TolC